MYGELQSEIQLTDFLSPCVLSKWLCIMTSLNKAKHFIPSTPSMGKIETLKSKGKKKGSSELGRKG